MTIKEIVAGYLRINKYDGLYDPGECACKIDDLAPCECVNFNECRPGYLGPPDEELGWDYTIGPGKKG